MSPILFSASAGKGRSYVSRVAEAARRFIAALFAVKIARESTAGIQVRRDDAGKRAAPEFVDDGNSPLDGAGAWGNLSARTKYFQG